MSSTTITPSRHSTNTTTSQHHNLKPSPSSIPSPSPHKIPTKKLSSQNAPTHVDDKSHSDEDPAPNVTAISNSLFKEHLHRHNYTTLLQQFNSILSQTFQPVITSRTELRHLLHISSLFQKGVKNDRSYLELLIEKRFLDERELSVMKQTLKDQLEERNGGEESNVQHLTNQLEDQTMKLRHEKMKYNDLNDEHLKVLAKMESVNQQVHELNEEIFLLKRKEKTMGIDNNSMNGNAQRINELESQLSDKESQTTVLKEELDALSTKNSTLKDKMRSLEETIVKKQEHIHDRQNLEDNQELWTLKSQIDEKEEEIRILKKEIVSLQGRIPELETETNTLRSQLDDKEEELHSLKMEMEDQNEYTLELQSSLKSKESALDDLRSSFNEKVDTTEDTESPVAGNDAQGNVEEWKSKVEELNDEIEYMKKEHAKQLKALQRELSDAENSSTIVSQMVEEESDEHEDKQTNRQELDKIDMLQSEVSEWQNKQEELQGELQRAHSSHETELQHLQDQIEEWKSKYEQLCQEKEDGENLAETVDTLKATLKQRTQKIGELEAKLRDMTAEVAANTKESPEKVTEDYHVALQEKADFLKEQEARIEHLKKKTSRLKSDRKKLQEYVHELEKELDEYEEEDRD